MGACVGVGLYTVEMMGSLVAGPSMKSSRLARVDNRLLEFELRGSVTNSSGDVHLRLSRAPNLKFAYSAFFTRI